MTNKEIRDLALELAHGTNISDRLINEQYNNRGYTAKTLFDKMHYAAGDIEHYAENAEKFVKPDYLYYNMTAAEFAELIKQIWDFVWRLKIIAEWEYHHRKRGHKATLARRAVCFEHSLNFIVDGFDYKTEKR